MALPLEGIRVVDLTMVWAGPHATQLLADWGAEVIRVESTQVMQPNTRGRLAKPPAALVRARRNWGFGYPDWEPGERPWNRFAIFTSHARNKKSMTVDLTKPEGRDLFLRLVNVSDVFVENNVPATIEKLRLSYDDLRKVRPDLVMLRMPGYGLSGPYRDYRTFGANLEGTVGHTWLRGYMDMDVSARDEVYMGDAAAGISGAFAVMMALRHRRRTGTGQLIELAQAENFLPYLGEAIMDYTMSGRVQETLGNRHRSRAPQGVYRCQGQDRWVTISVGGGTEWAGLCRAMGGPAWGGAARFATGLGRWKNQDILDERIAEWTRERKADEVMRLLQAEGVPCGPALDDRDLYNDPHLNALDYFQPLAHPDIGSHSYPGLMWTARNTPNRVRTPPCGLGDHNEYVYRDLFAFDDASYRLWRETGHIGEAYVDRIP